MKKFVKILAVVIAVLVVWSLIPVAGLYLAKNPRPYTNDDVVRKLKENKGDLFEFIILSDPHSGLIFNDSATLKLIRRINREDRFKKIQVDFVAVAGDVTFRGSGRDYLTYNKMRSLIKYPVVSAIGNHDNDKNENISFEKYVGSRELSFSDRNSFFILVDNTTNDISEKQFENIESKLRSSQDYAHRFIIMHKLPISPYQQSWYRPGLSPWSYRFIKLCEKYKVDMIFSGHEHMFKSGKFGNVKYVVAGGGGMLTTIPAPDGGFLHYVVVRVNGDYIDYEVRKVFPPLWECLAYYMWKDLFYFLKDVIF